MCLLEICYVIVILVGGVFGDIRMSPSMDEIEQYLNDTFVVSCHGDETENTSWRGPNGQIITSGPTRVHVEEKVTNREHRAVLIFDKIERSDRGLYTCTAGVRGQLQQVSFNLTVVRPISFLPQQTSQKLVEGQNSLIRCDVHGDPRPVITWYFQGKAIYARSDISSRYTQYASGLFITNVSRDDEGTYSCRAFQSTAKTSKFESLIIYVTVLQKPRWPDVWKSEHEVAYGYVGGVANISCYAEGRPYAGYAWTRQNRTINSNYGRVIQEEHYSVLQLKVIDARVFGEYECMADNGVGRIRKKFTLVEGRKPDMPTRVRLLGVTSSTATIEAESSNDRDVLLGYRIEFEKVGKYGYHDWEQPEYQDFIVARGGYKIINLIPRLEYKFRVATKSISGLSDFTREFRFTTSTGTQCLTTPFFLIASASLLLLKSLISPHS